MKIQLFVFVILVGFVCSASFASDRGSLRVASDHEKILTYSAVSAPEFTDEKAPPSRLEWKNLTLQREGKISDIPVDLTMEFFPEFSAGFGDSVGSVITIVSGELVVDPKGRAEVWKIHQGHYGNQIARSVYNPSNGALNFSLPVVLENAGIKAGTHLVVACERAASSWTCTKGSVVFEEMRQQSLPNASIDDVLRNWEESVQ